MSVFAVAMVAVMVTMALALVRALRGPTIFDRILAVNSFGTATVLFISVHGYLAGRPDFLDLALVYALMNFIGTLAVLKYLHAPGLGAADLAPPGEEGP
ncbi:MAG: pH regulation protein F [Alphaproteobacteria bacterium]|nr:pH regulation protein F [Alphaproteobacteria bacterium]